jgi:hypothetical protein
VSLGKPLFSEFGSVGQPKPVVQYGVAEKQQTDRTGLRRSKPRWSRSQSGGAVVRAIPAISFSAQGRSFSYYLSTIYLINKS